jgi:hypothetical protein
MALGGVAMAAVIGSGLPHVLWFVGAMTIYLAGLGFALPATMAGALTPFPDRAGTASSVMGLAQQTGAALSAAAVGAYLGRSAWPVASGGRDGLPVVSGLAFDTGGATRALKCAISGAPETEAGLWQLFGEQPKEFANERSNQRPHPQGHHGCIGSSDRNFSSNGLSSKGLSSRGVGR